MNDSELNLLRLGLSGLFVVLAVMMPNSAPTLYAIISAVTAGIVFPSSLVKPKDG